MDVSALTISVIENEQLMQEAQKIRFTVFVEEQHVPRELELDQFEQCSTHLLARINDHAVGTLRFRVYQQFVKIERVAILPKYRGLDLGRQLMQTAEQIIHQRYPGQSILLYAQQRSLKFYLKLGYQQMGEPFLQAGIEHIKCIKEI